MRDIISLEILRGQVRSCECLLQGSKGSGGGQEVVVRGLEGESRWEVLRGKWH